MEAPRPKTSAACSSVETIRTSASWSSCTPARGLTVVSKSDGNEALRAGPDDAFALIVLDLMLPPGRRDLCRAIRRDSRNTDVPILMLTARRDKCKVLGLDSAPTIT